jgi:hypothetical protein
MASRQRTAQTRRAINLKDIFVIPNQNFDSNTPFPAGKAENGK